MPSESFGFGLHPIAYIIIYLIGGIIAIIFVWWIVKVSKTIKERADQITQDFNAAQKYRIKPTSQESKIVSKYCQNCGIKFVPTTNFCINCGQNLND